MVEERDVETFGFPIPGPVQAKFKPKAQSCLSSKLITIQLPVLAFPSKARGSFYLFYEFYALLYIKSKVLEHNSCPCACFWGWGWEKGRFSTSNLSLLLLFQSNSNSDWQLRMLSFRSRPIRIKELCFHPDLVQSESNNWEMFAKIWKFEVWRKFWKFRGRPKFWKIFGWNLELQIPGSKACAMRGRTIL